MQITTTAVVSIGELNVESGSGYVAALTTSYPQPDTTITRVARDADAPIVSNVALGVQTYYLEVYVMAADNPDDTDARRRALLRQLDSSAGLITVVIRNQSGAARQRYMLFVVRQVEQVKAAGFLATLESVDDVRWQSVTAEEEVWSLTESGTRNIVVDGDLDVYPTYILTPTLAQENPNFPYSRAALIEWRSLYEGIHPIDVTGGGLDTAALLTAGKITDRSNIAVMVNGVLKRHWYSPDGAPGAFGSAQTHIWVNMQFDPALYPTLDATISSTATTWAVADDHSLPDRGTLKVDSEIITYTGHRDGFLYNVSRGQYGTTATGHNKYAPMTHYPVAVQILYGPTAAPPPEMQDEAYQTAKPPVFLGSGSDNEHWVFESFAGNGQTKSWGYSGYLNGLGYVKETDAVGSVPSEWSYPWTAIGLRAAWTSSSSFRVRLAVPISRLQVDGRHKILLNPAGSPNAPLLSVWDEAGQNIVLRRAGNGASRETNQPFAWSLPVSMAGTFGYNTIIWGVSGNSYVQADIKRLAVTFADGWTPAVTMFAEQTDYDLNATLTNTTTGESITVQFPNMAIGQSLVIDSRLQTVTYTADGSNQYTAVQRDAPRPRFLRLAPGLNTFQVAEYAPGGLDITIQYRPRWYT